MVRQNVRCESPPPPQKICRVLRLVGWNILLLVVGLTLIGSAGEAWLQLATPFVGSHFPKQFVPNVGVVGKSNMKVRWTNNHDFWTVSQTNSLGFVAREPLSPEHVATSCRVAVIGDSFVEANEVAVTDKFHVRLGSPRRPGTASPARYCLGIRADGHGAVLYLTG